MNPTTPRFAALAVATSLTLTMLMGIDALAHHESQDARLAALARPEAAPAAPRHAAVDPGCPLPAAPARS